MIAIREEIAESKQGKLPREDNPLKHAPHTAGVRLADRVDAPLLARARRVPGALDARAASSGRRSARLNNALGDRKLICACPPIESYQ